MKLINILIFLLLQTSNAFADTNQSSKVSPTNQNTITFNLSDAGKINVISNQDECYCPLRDTSLIINWQVNGKEHTQQLINDGYPTISNIQGDDDGVIITNPGNRFDSDEFRYHVRYRFSKENNSFYEAETWTTDTWWNPYIKELDDHLKQGSFAKARALVLKHGTSRNAGHTYHDTEFFQKFLNAELREARRAWIEGRAETASQFMTALVDKIPFYENSHSLDKDKAYFFPMTSPEILKLTGNKRNFFNVLEATDKNHKLIRDLSFYLIEGGESTLALDLMTQASRLQPNHSEVWFLLGEAYQLQGNTEMAKDVYQHFYSIMRKQKKIAGVPSKILRILGKYEELSLREKTKKQWLEYKSKHTAYALEYQGYVGEMPIKMFVLKEKYNDSHLRYYDSAQKRKVFLQKEKELNGYFVAEDEGKHDNPFMVWVLKYSFGEPISGWRVLPTGERQQVVLSPQALL